VLPLLLDEPDDGVEVVGELGVPVLVPVDVVGPVVGDVGSVGSVGVVGRVVVLLVGGLVGVVSSRGGDVVSGGRVVPGGTTVPGGSGVPGGSTIGFSPEPSGGSRVTTCVPSGLVVTTAVREPSGSATPSTVTGACPGAASPGISWAPELELGPLGIEALAESPGAMKEARPAKAVTRTTPLTASNA